MVTKGGGQMTDSCPGSNNGGGCYRHYQQITGERNITCSGLRCDVITYGEIVNYEKTAILLLPSYRVQCDDGREIHSSMLLLD